MEIGETLTSGLTSTPGAESKAKNSPERIRAAASQFEALLINQMLQSASASGDGSWMGNEDGENSSLVELGRQQFAQALANQGGLGIAKMVVAGLEKHENR